MRNAGRALVVASFLFLMGTVSYAIGQRCFHAVLVCQQPTVNLGTIDLGEHPRHVFEISNAGWKPLAVQSVRTSCGACIKVVSYPDKPIPAGGSGKIEVELLSEKLKGTVTKNVIIVSNDRSVSSFILRVTASILGTDATMDKNADAVSKNEKPSEPQAIQASTDGTNSGR